MENAILSGQTIEIGHLTYTVVRVEGTTITAKRPNGRTYIIAIEGETFRVVGSSPKAAR